MKKHGIIVGCEHCTCISIDDHGGFDVTVPVSDRETGIAGRAQLHCAVSPERHIVELTEWQDADRHPIELSEDLQQRVSGALTFVADRRICGSRNICPSEVIRVVEGNSKP